LGNKSIDERTSSSKQLTPGDKPIIKRISSKNLMGSNGSSKNIFEKSPETEGGLNSPGKSLWRKASILVAETRAQRSMSREFMTNEFTGKIIDGLSCSLKAPIIRMKGTFLKKTASGHYKQGLIILKNAELYIYNDF
jgi:hypothetical protein